MKKRNETQNHFIYHLLLENAVRNILLLFLNRNENETNKKHFSITKKKEES